MIGKSTFKKSQNQYVSPLLTINRQNGAIHFNLSAIQKYELEQYTRMIFWLMNPDDDEIYLSATNNVQEGYLITRYKANKGENFFLKMCSKHMTEFIAKVYKLPTTTTKMIFYLNVTDRKSTEGFPVFSLLRKNY
jgi:hypothetical protein